jgi:hypothetical protein
MTISTLTKFVKAATILPAIAPGGGGIFMSLVAEIAHGGP